MIKRFDIGAVSRRLVEGDMLQVLGGYLAVLAVVMVLFWPGGTERANNSWFAVAQTMTLLLALIAVAYGSVSEGRTEPPKPLTLVSVLCIAALGLPIAVAAYAASFPDVPLSWMLAIVPLQVVAYFGLGMLLGFMLRALRVGFLLPLAVPALVAGTFMADVWLGIPLLSPAANITLVSTTHVAAMATLAAGTLAAMAWRIVRTEKEAQVP